TGKELVARAIHDRSPRRDRPLVRVNCSAISAGLVESELFGHVRGAFTGATTARMGRFEVADGGTIFLDEIGDLPLEMQVKLLRVLQEREIEPVGSSRTRRVDVRVIAATNRNLEQEVAAGRFRADLYFRLNVVPIVMPPLREREGDIALLAEFFADRFAREFGKRIERIAPESLERLFAYSWPGNVRELSNVIERAVVLARGPELEIAPELLSQALGPARDAEPAAPRLSATDRSDAITLEENERRHIEETLERTDWVIEGERGSAAALGLSASTLRSRMKKLGVRRPPR
ncbi:MAG: Fis family transcriptional regulator, partial [Deltaproteobacteria bacterium]